MWVEHVIGEEKYECEMLNVFVIVSKRFCGRVCCDVFSKSFLVFWSYIFGIAILLLFRMIAGGY